MVIKKILDSSGICMHTEISSDYYRSYRLAIYAKLRDTLSLVFAACHYTYLSL